MGVSIVPFHAWEDSGPATGGGSQKLLQLTYGPGDLNSEPILKLQPCARCCQMLWGGGVKTQAHLLPGFHHCFHLKVWGCVLPTLDLASPAC